MTQKQRSGQKVKLVSVDELLKVPEGEATEKIAIRDIRPFSNHPFKVIDDEKMDELVESIRENGVLTPIIVRTLSSGGYEMISGHRRMHAAKLLGIETIPAVVKELSDEEATVIMVDSNIQREELLPSEKAFALKMKMDALRHQGTSRHEVGKLGVETASVVGEGSGMGGRQVQRYIRLTELIPELLDLVDSKRL